MPSDPSVVIEDADLLGEFSTDDGKCKRWVEMQLVGSEAGYFIFGCGRSRVPGEIDRPWAKWFPEAFLVVRALLSPPAAGRQENTTEAARTMLAHAQREDEGIDKALRAWRG